MSAVIQLEPFENVLANGKAVLNSTRLLGNAVEQIILQLGGTFTKAMISLLRIRVNQKTVWEVTGSDLDTIQLYNAHPAAATFLSVMFTEPRARDIIGQLAGALDTSFGVNNVTIEVDIVGATAPTLAAWALVSPAQTKQGPAFASVAPLFRAILPTTVPISAAVNDAQYAVNVGSVAGALIKRLYICNAAALTRFRVKRDGVEIFENVVPALNNFYQDEYAHDPQASTYVVDFMQDDNLSNSLPTLRPDGRVATHQFLFTTNAAATLRVYADVLAPLNLL